MEPGKRVEHVFTPPSSVVGTPPVPSKKRKESPTISSDEETLLTIKFETTLGETSGAPAPKQRKIEAVVSKDMEVAENEGYLGTVEKIHGNLDGFVALVTVFDASQYTQQAHDLYNSTWSHVNQLKSKIESLLGEVAELQSSQTKREARLEPVDPKEYHERAIAPIKKAIEELQGTLTVLHQEVKTYQIQGVTKEEFAARCLSYIEQYEQLAKQALAIQGDVSAGTVILQEKITASTAVPHSEEAIATNIALVYVPSREQNINDQKCLDENKQQYMRLKDQLDQIQSREFDSAMKSLCDTLIQGKEGLNWLCYQCECLIKSNKLPYSYYTTPSVPITVINPFDKKTMHLLDGAIASPERKELFAVQEPAKV